MPFSAAPLDLENEVVDRCYAIASDLLESTFTHSTDSQRARLLNSSLNVTDGRVEIGKGSFGTVYQLDRKEYGGNLAVKTQKVSTPQALERLLREASFMDVASLLGGGSTSRGALALHCIVFTPGPRESDSAMFHLVMENAAGNLQDELERMMAKVRWMCSTMLVFDPQRSLLKRVTTNFFTIKNYFVFIVFTPLTQQSIHHLGGL